MGWGTDTPVFGFLVKYPLGLKAILGSLIHTWLRQTCYTILRFTSGVTAADRLVASMAAAPISSTYLRTGIGGAQNWDLSYCRRMLLPYELCQLSSWKHICDIYKSARSKYLPFALFQYTPCLVCFQINVLFVFRVDVWLTDGYFYTSNPTPTGWFHIVLNYIGPNNGEGIRMFINGAEVASKTTKSVSSYTPSSGDGRIIVGRTFTNSYERYTSLQIDELVYFNQDLNTEEIIQLYNDL